MEAALSITQSSLATLLEKFPLLVAECSRMKGVRKQIRFLRNELESMHGSLQTVETLEDPGFLVKTWARELRELSYDMEDCIDKFTNQLRDDEPRGQGAIKEFFLKCANFLKRLRYRRQFVCQMDELMSRVIEVAERRDRYRLGEDAGGTSGHTAVDPRLSALFAEEAHLVGIEGPRDDIASWLLAGAESELGKHRKVLSIVGFGGLGKTTLANQVYRKIGGQFDICVFVSVSQKPNMKKLLGDVLSQVDPIGVYGYAEIFHQWDEKEQIGKLRELLHDKRYLVVIDDVWSISKWEVVKCVFPENSCSSRIITTTRIVDVARSCCSCDHDRLYEIEPLNDLHSKRLFFRRIFGREDDCPDLLQAVSNEILKKCGGLPLAIISISGILANKPPNKQEWEKVKKSISFALDKDQRLEGMKSILSLSYNDLPGHLKACLLYLSVFPEDCVIERDRLVRRWIVEGIIPREGRHSLQEVAESYFYELINKNMVQPVDIGCDGKVHACRIHDMMLELIISKATEENFVTVLSGQTDMKDWHVQHRRLLIQCTGQEFPYVLAGKDLRHTRSLTATGRSIKCVPPLVEFEALRVLDFEDCRDFEEYGFKSWGKLFQLKYLSLKGTWISEVPTEIVELHDLETLDLRETYLKELPAGIVKLTKLLHLHAARQPNAAQVKIPDGIGNMRNLQELSGFNISTSSVSAVEELGNLTNLLSLHIQLNNTNSREKRHEEMLLSSLCKLGCCKLQFLWILSQGKDSPIQFLDSWSPLPCTIEKFVMITDYSFQKIPKWITSALTNLARLDINISEVTNEDLRVIGELPALLFLELWFRTDPKEKLTVRGFGFRYLKEFYFVCGPNDDACCLTFDEGAMPNLEKLKLPFRVSMARAYGFYLGFEHLLCLREAEVKLFKEGAEDFETNAAEVAIRNEANVHPNHPRVTIVGKYDERREASLMNTYYL